MSNRTSTVTMLAVGCAFLLAITLLVILQKSQESLELSQSRLHLTEANYHKVQQQFEALMEYKDRLEKSYMTFKTEKASQFMPDKFAEMDIMMAKESHARQVQLLQDELKDCRTKERENLLSSGKSDTIPSNDHKGIEFLQLPRGQDQVPITSSSSTVNRHVHINSPELKSSAALAEELKQHLNGNNMKEAIQSPIGHVPPVPALPSGDPNEDLAGNVIE